MSPSSFALLPPPPLPLGWSEHIAPGGQTYYYNAQTQESTYVRPIPAFPIMPTVQPESTRKKEKPLVKTRIPGTDWLRVKTTEGNIFYSHKIKKESVWTVPEEIQDAVEELEHQESQELGHPKPDTIAEEEARKAEHELSLEVARVKAEVQAMVKRKAEKLVYIDEGVITKKARIEEDEQEGDGESDEEEWQREAAAQLAFEAEADRKRLEETERAQKAAEDEVQRLQATAPINMPERVDLSLEEAKALFKESGLLREKDINPLHPWDTSLPQFVGDPRYVLLPSVSARREAFDEYCRDRARELRQSTIKKERGAASPKEEFEILLNAEVKSTRSTWTDFRRTWKKDRRFYGWGRDDREREKRFREFIKDLGEKKRAAAEKSEAGFFALLRERGVVGAGSIWKEVKRRICDDPRYDAVGSSSLREELFTTFLNGSHLTASLGPDQSMERTSEDAELGKINDESEQQQRWERKERAVKEREEKVKAERDRLEVDIGRSRMGMNKEEGEREFKSLLVDAVRDPQMTWSAALPQLKTDPRFRNSPLLPNLQLHLFHTHVGHLRSRHMDSLRALFESYAPSLATAFSALPLPSLLASLPVTKLGFDKKIIESEFEQWQRECTHGARKAFDGMLAENSFVEFWGRLGKIGGEGVDGGVKADEIGEDEGEGGGGKVDMKVLARSVDVSDMEKVLKNDKRYIMFEHIPQQREQWIRDYLSQLTAPKLSVHLPQP